MHPLSRLHPALPGGHAGSKGTTWAGKVGRECDLLAQNSSIKDQTIDVRTFLSREPAHPPEKGEQEMSMWSSCRLCLRQMAKTTSSQEGTVLTLQTAPQPPVLG